MKNDSNKNVIIGILIGIIIMLVVVIVLFATGVFSLSMKDVNNENNSGLIDNNDTKGYVYDADYNLPTDKESYYGGASHDLLIKASDLVVPYINLDSKDAKEVNEEIYDLYEDLIDTFNENLKDSVWYTTVEYKTYTNYNIMSVIITTTSGGTDVLKYEYYAYNFDLNTGDLLTYEDIYIVVGFTENNIEDKVTLAISNVMRDEYSLGEDFDRYNDMSINNYKESVKDNDIVYFIDQNKKLNIVVELNAPVGRGEFDTVITVE